MASRDESLGPGRLKRTRARRGYALGGGMRRLARQQVTGLPPGALVLGSAGWIGGQCILTDVGLAYWLCADGKGIWKFSRRVYGGGRGWRFEKRVTALRRFPALSVNASWGGVS